jgi:YggT family protein
VASSGRMDDSAEQPGGATLARRAWGKAGRRACNACASASLLHESRYDVVGEADASHGPLRSEAERRCGTTPVLRTHHALAPAPARRQLTPMNDVFGVLRAVSGGLRYALFAAAVVAGVVAAVDWAVRTRRLNPFGATARFFRRTVDPLMVPIERRVVRAGGRPSSAPLWALGVVVVGGLLLIALVDFLTSQIGAIAGAFSSGAAGMLMLLVAWTFSLLRVALIVRVISSWVGVSPYSAWVRWSYGLTEWMLAPLRRLIPLFGGIDVTPIIAYVALRLIESIVVGALTR